MERLSIIRARVEVLTCKLEKELPNLDIPVDYEAFNEWRRLMKEWAEIDHR